MAKYWLVDKLLWHPRHCNGGEVRPIDGIIPVIGSRDHQGANVGDIQYIAPQPVTSNHDVGSIHDIAGNMGSRHIHGSEGALLVLKDISGALVLSCQGAGEGAVSLGAVSFLVLAVIGEEVATGDSDPGVGLFQNG